MVAEAVFRERPKIGINRRARPKNPLGYSYSMFSVEFPVEKMWTHYPSGSPFDNPTADPVFS